MYTMNEEQKKEKEEEAENSENGAEDKEDYMPEVRKSIGDYIAEPRERRRQRQQEQEENTGGKENEAEVEVENTLERCEKEKEEYLNGWQRAKADFINYKREEEERALSTIRLAQEVLLREIIAVLNSFDLGLISWKEESPEKKGMTLVRIQLAEVLKKCGLREITVKIGAPLDLKTQEAVGLADSDKTSDSVVEEVEKGYYFHDKVIRPARVKVAK